MSYTCFEVEIENKIAHIKLSRPEKRNAMSPEFWDELPTIVRDIDGGSKARVIVISSTGPHFTAGLDIQAFLGMGQPDGGSKDTPDNNVGIDSSLSFYHNTKLMQETFSVLEDCRIPVLAAIQGGCIGGGVDFTTACDMRYVSEDAYFTIHETNIGMTADVGTFPRLLNLIPEGIVRELSYTGRKMPAKEALSHGLVNGVYSDQASMLEEVMKIAGQIASQAPNAVYGCKRMINYSRDHNTADSLDYIVTWNMSMLQQEQMAEAMMANAQKRAGDFAELPPLPTAINSKK